MAALNNEFDEVMDQIGFGKIHILAILANGMLQMLTTIETMAINIIAPASLCDLKMNMQQQSAITAATFLGIICASYFWGYVTDKVGRRYILIRTILCCNLCSVISMFMNTFPSFFMMRFITGIFLACPSFVAVTYLSEFCSRQTMAQAVAFTYMFNGMGMCYAPGLATIILDLNMLDFDYHLWYDTYYHPWRLLGHCYIVPGVIAFCLIWLLPESPKFLFMIGDERKGIDALSWISRKNNGSALSEAQIIKMRKYAQDTVKTHLKKRNNIFRTMLFDAMPLFRLPYVRMFCISCSVMFSLGLIANGLGLWFTDMRNRRNWRDLPGGDQTICTFMFGPCDRIMSVYEQDSLDDVICNSNFHGFMDSLRLGVTFLVMYKICGLLLNIMKRSLLFVIALVIAGSCGFLLLAAAQRHVQILCFVLFLALPGVVWGLLGGALLEFVPTHLRAKAVCICLMWGRFGAIVGTKLVGYFLADYCEVTIMLISLVPFYAASMESILPL